MRRPSSVRYMATRRRSPSRGLRSTQPFSSRPLSAREVRALVRSGAVRGLSIGFVTRKAAARPGGGRTITSLELMEVSLVTLPMHPGARVTSAKSAVEALRVADAINRIDAPAAASALPGADGAAGPLPTPDQKDHA